MLKMYVVIALKDLVALFIFATILFQVVCMYYNKISLKIKFTSFFESRTFLFYPNITNKEVYLNSPFFLLLSF